MSTMHSYVLYSYWRSSCSYRIRIALHYKNLSFEYRPIHLVKDGGEQNTPEFKQLNPKGEVPVLVDGDFVLGQSMAILQYLENKHPQRPLFPKSAQDHALCLQLCETINAGTQPIQNFKVMQELKSRFAATQDQACEWNKHFIGLGLQSFEQLLKDKIKKDGPYCLGDEFSAVDCFLVPQVYNAIRFNVDMETIPHVQQIYETCLEREDVKKSIPENQSDAPK